MKWYSFSDTNLKFLYSEKAIKFCESFTLLLTVCTAVKSKGKISQNFVAFSEYKNFVEAVDAIALGISFVNLWAHKSTGINSFLIK